MSSYEGLEPDEYEVTWKSGHVERFKAHQVSWPNSLTAPIDARVICFHVETPEKRWALVLQCQEADLQTVRNVTQTEAVL